MQHFNKLLLFLFLLPLISIAQSNYKPGLIVSLKGDTVHGFINYKEWENNPAGIGFKSSLNQAARQYTADDITFFQITRLDTYLRYSGPISTDATNIAHLSTGKDTSFKTAVVFLKLEQEGKYVSLYSYSDDTKKRYFISEKTNSEPVELIYRSYYSPDQNGRSVSEERYKGQLIYLSAKYKSNTDELRTEIENSGYDQDILNIINKINRTTSQPSFNKKSGISFYAGISSGMSYLKPPNTEDFYSGNYSYDESYLPALSFGMNVYTNPEVGRLIFRGEVTLSANKFKTYFNEYYDGGTKSDLTLNQITLSFNPQILYNIYNTDSFKFYLETGFSASFSKNSNNNLYNTVNGEATANYIQLNSVRFTIPLTAGITLNNKVGIFITYTIPTVISQNNVTYYNTQVGVTYTFGTPK